MSLKLKKKDLELLSNKDIAELILQNSKRTLNTADLFRKIMNLLELPESTFEAKIADFYTSLATDKRFILLDNGKWDLRVNHTSDKIIKVTADEEDEEEELEEDEEDKDISDEDLDEDSYDDKDDEVFDIFYVSKYAKFYRL